RRGSATGRKRHDGKYVVSFKGHAAKIYVEGVGKETPATLDEPIDIGVFARGASGKEKDEKVLLLEKRAVVDGDGTVTLTVDELPYEVGIDPYNKLIDRVPDDNRTRVTLH